MHGLFFKGPSIILMTNPSKNKRIAAFPEICFEYQWSSNITILAPCLFMLVHDISFVPTHVTFSRKASYLGTKFQYEFYLLKCKCLTN